MLLRSSSAFRISIIVCMLMALNLKSSFDHWQSTERINLNLKFRAETFHFNGCFSYSLSFHQWYCTTQLEIFITPPIPSDEWKYFNQHPFLVISRNWFNFSFWLWDLRALSSFTLSLLHMSSTSVLFFQSKIIIFFPFLRTHNNLNICGLHYKSLP